MATKGTVYVGKEQGEKARVQASVREEQKLDTLAQETETVIYEASSVFPFQIFPDKIIVDKNKITIVRKELFFKRIFPILYEDIQTVRVNRGIFFASMEFEVRGFDQSPSPVTHLWPEKAAKAEQLILGMTKAKREMIDLTKISTKAIRPHIEKIGDSGEDVQSLF